MIKNLIFDVGRVLIDYDHQNLLKNMDLSLDDMEEICRCIFDNDIWQNQFDRGLLTVEEVTEKLVERSPQWEEGIRYALSHPERMPLSRPEVMKRVDILRKSGYRTYYLSNYSTYFFNIHAKQTGILEYLDGGVLSAEVHYIKPEKEIYEILLQRYNLNPEECLFFDDRKDNIDGAKSVGMETFWVNSEKKVIEKLDNINNVLQKV